MPTFYNFRQDGIDYSFDDIFVPADLFRDGTLWTWGYGSYGQLGNSTTSFFIYTPITTFAGGTNWKQVSCGSLHIAAIKTDGTLWTWGEGDAGKLGNNFTTIRSTPVTTFAGGTDWKQVSCGGDHTAAIKTDGTLWTWGEGGSGSSGPLGNNSTTNKLTPVTTFAGGTNWKQVSSGINHTSAIKTDGTLWIWGVYFLLGRTLIANALTPVTTFAGGTNWKQVSCGVNHTAAVKTDGTLWTWGYGNYGQLGNNYTLNNTSTPLTTFAGGTDWKQVSCGSNYTAAVKTDGTLWVWGLGSNGRLGNNSTTIRSTPVTTFAGGTDWKQVSCGSNHTAAVKTDGTLWIWGLGASTGTNNSTQKNTPVTTFAGGTNWRQVSSGINISSSLTYEDPVL
jgi:alpha-tubulin suppressor-like RCC1 family protein